MTQDLVLILLSLEKASAKRDFVDFVFQQTEKCYVSQESAVGLEACD